MLWSLTRHLVWPVSRAIATCTALIAEARRPLDPVLLIQTTPGASSGNMTFAIAAQFIPSSSGTSAFTRQASGGRLPCQLDQVLPRFAVQEAGLYHEAGTIQLAPFGKGGSSPSRRVGVNSLSVVVPATCIPRLCGLRTGKFGGWIGDAAAADTTRASGGSDWGSSGSNWPQVAPARTNIRFMFHAMVTRLHSQRTLSRPRSRNWRNPSADLMMPNAFLSQTNAGMHNNLTNAAKEALFQQFLVWDKQRSVAR